MSNENIGASGGTGGGDDLRSIGEELIRLSDEERAVATTAAVNPKQVFCLLWPIVKRLLRRLVQNAPDPIRELIERLIEEGDRFCRQ